MEEPPRHRGAPSELAVAALVGAAALPLARIFRTGGVGPVAVGAVAGSLAAAWLLRRARLPVLLSGALSGLAFTWFATALFFRETMVGPFPSAESFRALSDAFSDGLRASRIDVAPVAATEPFRLLVASAVWSTAWLADDAAVRLRNPLLGIGLALPLFLVPGTLVESSRRMVDAGLFLVAAAWVLYTAQRTDLRRWGTVSGPHRPGWRPGPALRLGATGIAATLALAPLLPGYGQPPLTLRGARGPRVAYNPLVSIKPTLNYNPVRELFRVVAPEPSYYRLTALDHFDGRFWTARPRRASVRIAEEEVPPDVAGSPGRRLDQGITIAALAGPWLPAAFEPLRVYEVPGVRAEPDTRAIIAPEELRGGMRYLVRSRIPAPSPTTLDAVQAADLEDPALRRFTALPDSLPPEIGRIARRIAGDRPTPFQKAVALQDHLRRFTYDEEVAAGHDFDTLVEFLTVARRGYCEQFAGAMAVLARSLGLPARVAVGFAAGEPAGPRTFRVTTRQAHAWVEIFFPGAGWLAFEPTPRAGVAVVPPYAETIAPRPDEVPEPVPTATALGPQGAPTRRPEPREAAGSRGRAGGAPGWLVLALVTAGLAGAAGGLSGGAWLRRRLRIGRAATPGEAVALRYLDFLGWCAAAGHPRAPGETPREHAGRLARLSEPAAGPLGLLAAHVEAALWAPPNGLRPEAAAEAIGEARSALAGALSRRARALAVLGWGRWRSG